MNELVTGVRVTDHNGRRFVTTACDSVARAAQDYPPHRGYTLELVRGHQRLHGFEVVEVIPS